MKTPLDRGRAVLQHIVLPNHFASAFESYSITKLTENRKIDFLLISSVDCASTSRHGVEATTSNGRRGVVEQLCIEYVQHSDACFPSYFSSKLRKIEIFNFSLPSCHRLSLARENFSQTLNKHHQIEEELLYNNVCPYHNVLTRRSVFIQLQSCTEAQFSRSSRFAISQRDPSTTRRQKLKVRFFRQKLLLQHIEML